MGLGVGILPERRVMGVRSRLRLYALFVGAAALAFVVWALWPDEPSIARREDVGVTIVFGLHKNIMGNGAPDLARLKACELLNESGTNERA